MSFLTTILRRSGDYWVALCLENGVVSQGSTKEEALVKMSEAVASLQLAFSDDASLFTVPIAINELHEFLSVDGIEPTLETYELRAVHASKHSIPQAQGTSAHAGSRRLFFSQAWKR